MWTPASNNFSLRILGVLGIIIGFVGIGFGIFYLTTDTSFLASDFGRHYTHAAGAMVLGLFFLIGGLVLFMRKPKAKSIQNSTSEKST